MIFASKSRVRYTEHSLQGLLTVSKLPCRDLSTMELLTNFSFLIFLFLPLVYGSKDWRWNPKSTEPEFSLVKVYLFNVTNPEATINGEVPVLAEVGPYVYRLRRERFNISTTSMNTVRYQQRHTYEFLSDRSTGSLEDVISFVNVPFVSAVDNLYNIPVVGLALIDTLVKSKEKLVRTNERVGDILWDGIDVSQYQSVLASLGQSPPAAMAGGRFGILKSKNGTDEGQMEVEDRPSYLHGSREIVSWRNMTSLKYWTRDSCNKIRGTDGTVFPPGVTSNSELSFFSPEACRSVSLVYEADEEVQSVSGLRFIFPDTLLESAEKHYPNTCYCKDYDDFEEDDYSMCLKKGAIDLSTCRGAPLATSYPHFLDADPEYLQDVQGLTPDKSLHSSSIVVEPETGTVLRSNLKFQLNVKTGPLSKIKALSHIKDYLFPAMWIENSYLLDNEAAEKLCSREESLNEFEGDSDNSIAETRSGKTSNSGNKCSMSIFILSVTLVTGVLF